MTVIQTRLVQSLKTNEQLLQERIDKVNEIVCNISKVGIENIEEVILDLTEALKEANTIGFFRAVKEQMKKHEKCCL